METEPTREICPPHPGLLLRDELEARGMSIPEAAKAMGPSRQWLYYIITGKIRITAKTAVMIGKLIGNEPRFWLNMQQAVDLWKAEAKWKAEHDSDG